jgi:hypothetical protein
MQLESAKLLEDICVAVTDALEMTAGKSYHDFTASKQLRYASERADFRRQIAISILRFTPGATTLFGNQSWLFRRARRSCLGCRFGAVLCRFGVDSCRFDVGFSWSPPAFPDC